MISTSTVRGLCLLLALLCVPTPGTAEHTPEEPDRESESAETIPLGERWSEGWTNVVDDARYLVTFPSRPTKRGVWWTAGTLAAIGVVMHYDERIRVESLEHRSATTDRWEGASEPFGSGAVTYALGALAWAGGRAFGNEELAETGRTLGETLFFTEIATAAAKLAFGRTEPPWGPDPTAGKFFDGGARFPSGHTSRAFAVAAVLTDRYGQRAGWVAYPIATLVGLGRIEKNRHWASDVVAGAALGWVIGKTVSRRRAERQTALGPTGEPRVQMLVAPMVSFDERMAGVQFMLSF